MFVHFAFFIFLANLPLLYDKSKAGGKNLLSHYIFLVKWRYSHCNSISLRVNIFVMTMTQRVSFSEKVLLFFLALLLTTLFSTCSFFYPLNPWDDANVYMTRSRSFFLARMGGHAFAQ